MNALFEAHCPQPGYLTELCRHSHCGFLSVAELRRAPDRPVAPFAHAHPAYEFLLPLTPMPIILQGDEVYFGRPGAVYPVESGVRHGQALEQCDISNISIAVNREFMRRRIAEKGLDSGQFDRFFPASDLLLQLLSLFQREFQGRQDQSDLESLGSLVVSELIECGIRQVLPPEVEAPVDALAAVETYIYGHFAEKLTLDALAAQCGLQKNHFITAFKRRYGEAPYARVMRLRLAKAKVLLRSTDYTVSHIAALSGFPSSMALANAFHKDTGMTPTQFREQ